MSRIVRISPSVFPNLPVRVKPAETEKAAPEATNIRIVNPTPGTATRRAAPLREGPSTPFLAQYVDQHWPWPRNANERVRARCAAAGAYETADKISLSQPQGKRLNRSL